MGTQRMIWLTRGLGKTMFSRALPLGLAQRFENCQADVGQLHRLVQKMSDVHARRARTQIIVAVGRHHDDGGQRIQASDARRQRQTVEAWHLVVRNEQIKRLLGKELQRLLTGGCHCDLTVGELVQAVLEHQRQIDLVVHNQYAALCPGNFN